MQYLTTWDLFLTPFFLLILAQIAKKRRDKVYPIGHPLRKYYLKGLYLKFAGAIFIGLIYQYYYHGGDTYNFFEHSKVINSSLSESLGIWIKLMRNVPLEKEPSLIAYVQWLDWYNEPPSYTVARIAAFFGLLSGTAYMPTALLFAYFSYTGIWAMFKTFVNIYPTLHKQLALAFLFIPSTIVWGSGIFKDTVCMFGLGWMIYTTFRLFVNRDFSVKNIALLLISFNLLYITKLYILMAFLPALSLWILMTYSSKIKSTAMRWVLNIVFMSVTAGGFLFLGQRFAAELNEYSLDNIAKTASVTREYISRVTGDEGSSYDLGDFDPSITGMLKKFPQAVVVTLFRPFFWEAKKVIVLLSSLESILFLFFTIRSIIASKGNIVKWLKKDPNMMFCLVFSLIFAFAVGISSYNFGALSRYKIPCLPFYAMFLMLLANKDKEHKRDLLRAQLEKLKARAASHLPVSTAS